MTSCYSFHGQITTDTVEMKFLATMSCEVYCTTQIQNANFPSKHCSVED